MEVGDLPSVRKLLISHKNLNVNCTDILGRTPMRLAVENEHQDVSIVCLSKCVSDSVNNFMFTVLITAL